MAVALVIDARDMRQAAHLVGGQHTIRHSHTQHLGMELQIKAVHQAKRLEFVCGQLTSDAVSHLVTKLGDPLSN